MTEETPAPNAHVRSKPIGLVAVVAVLAAAIGFVIGIAVPIGDSGGSDDDASDNRASSIAESEEPKAEPYSPTVDDFKIDVRVKEEQCFGTAGCSVTVGIEPSYVGTNFNYGDDPWEVTYEVTGDESGTIVQTMTLEGDNISFRDEIDLSTKSKAQKIEAKVTRVDPGH